LNLLAHTVDQGKSIPVDAVLSWLDILPDGLSNSYTTKLFKLRYEKIFGSGPIILPSKEEFSCGLCFSFDSYDSGSAYNFLFRAPNVTGFEHLQKLKQQFLELRDDCNAGTAKYEDFNRWRKIYSPNFPDPLPLLPKELNETNEQIEQLRIDCAKGSVSKVFLSSVPSHSQIPYTALPNPVKFTPKAKIFIHLLVKNLGYGVVPDPKYYNFKEFSDFIVFEVDHDEKIINIDEFERLVVIIRLGLLVSGVAEKDSGPNICLYSFIQENSRLSSIEKRSLIIFLYLCSIDPRYLKGVNSKTCSIFASDEKLSISALLLSIADSSHNFGKNELLQLEKIFSYLGFNKDDIVGRLHAISAANLPVTVEWRACDSRFALPNESSYKSSKSIQLNQELLKKREEETRQVKTVLEDVFIDSHDEDKQSADSIAITQPAENLLEKLDQAHRALFKELLSQDVWERSDFLAKCRKLGLMVDGAMEVLNEWAFDYTDAVLIEDGDRIYINAEVAMEMMNVK